MARTARQGVNSGKEDGRKRDYVPNSPFQVWAKPHLDKNAKEDVFPRDYTELAEAVTAKGVDASPSYMQKVIRGTDFRNPSYNLALAIGEVLNDVAGALRAAGHKMLTAKPNLTRELEADTIRVLDYYEGLPPGPLRRLALDHLQSLHRIAGEDFAERTDIIGKASDEDEDGITRISADEE